MSAEPFSRSIQVRDVPAQGRHFRIEADERERAGIADLLGIPAVESLAADMELRPLAGSAFSLSGQVSAVVVQTDIVTLEPIRQAMNEIVDLSLMPAETPRGRGRAKAIDVMEAEPDTFSNGRIDIGIIATEHLALGLDPYPRAEGVAFPDHLESDPEDDPSPFAALAGFQRRGG